MDELKTRAHNYTNKFNKALQHTKSRVQHHHHKKDAKGAIASHSRRVAPRRQATASMASRRPSCSPRKPLSYAQVSQRSAVFVSQADAMPWAPFFPDATACGSTAQRQLLRLLSVSTQTYLQMIGSPLSRKHTKSRAREALV